MIKLIKSAFYNELQTRKALNTFISSNAQLSFGPECLKFEKNFAAWQGRKYCIFFNNGSSANLALIQGLMNLGRLKTNDEVAFSALTWSTNVMPLIQLRLQPVPIDVELETLNTSSTLLTKILERRPLKAVFITNLLGLCDDLEKIRTLCKKRGIILLEDNCEALGTIYKGRKLGNFGLASTFSFFIGHHMSTVEGGAVCTDDPQLASMLRMVRAHGWDRHLEPAHQASLKKKHKIHPFHTAYTFYDLAYNLRPTEINGFLGNVQLRYLNKIVQKRSQNFKKVTRALHTGNERFMPIRSSHIDMISNFAVPVLCRTEKIRDQIVAACKDTIEIRPIVGGDMTQQPFFKKYFTEHRSDSLQPNADLIHRQGLYFGNNPDMTQQELKKILDIFNG